MKFIKENWSAIIFTILVHVVVLALFAMNIDFDREVVKPAHTPIVQAKIINGAAIDAEIKRQEKLEQNKLDEEIKRQKDLEDKVLQAKSQREAEEKRLADLEVERKKQIEIDKQKKLETDKKAQDEKKKLAELAAKRKIEEARLEDIKKEQAATKKQAAEEETKRAVAAEAKIKADLEAKKKAEEEREKKAAELAAKKKKEAEAEAARIKALEADLAAAMADEESLNEVIDDGALNRYRNQISQYIERSWRKPPSAQEGLSCTLNVKQLPGGDVASVSFGSCNADEATRASIEQAVFRAAPLPEPEDQRLFARDLEIIFAPEI